jgi:serine/threonine-protein kinase
MGEVYEAIGAGDQRVAIKLLTPASSLDEKIVERFRREAEITAALRSPHIVRVHAISESGAHVPYLVMERLSGKDLAEVLRKHVILEESSLVTLVEQIASGLAVAHAASVVHRDIKPHNLFADERSGKRVWKILDFGVSKLGEHSGTLTQGHVVGTPAYMAPEQAIGDASVGPAADTYALAAIAYRCLTGRPPFRGKSAAALLFNVVHQMPVRPSSLVRVSASVDSVLALGMAKDPIARIQSAAAFAEAFVAALGGRLESGLEARAREIELATPWRET